MGLALIPAVLGGITIAFVVGALAARRSLNQLPDHWRPATGIVVNAERPQLVAYLTPDGRRVELRGTLDPTYVVGQDVEVLVDPIDPTRARLVEADRAAALVARILLTLSVGFGLAAVLAVLTFG